MISRNSLRLRPRLLRPLLPAPLCELLRDERGGTAVEFALVLPLFLIIVFSTMYLSLMLGAFGNLQSATAQAARCLSVDVTGKCTSANIDTFAKKLYTGPTIRSLSFTASKVACGNQVVGSGTFAMFTGAGSVGVTLSSRACYPLP